jgi:hypothetical protein
VPRGRRVRGDAEVDLTAEGDSLFRDLRGHVASPRAELLSQFEADDIDTTVRTLPATTTRGAEGLVATGGCHTFGGGRVPEERGPPEERTDMSDPTIDIDDVRRDNRPFLIDLAFRMLGNIQDAEDVVRDAFSRLLRVELDSIEEIRGWLVVVVRRLCIDQMRSAKRRGGVTNVSFDDDLPAPHRWVRIPWTA